MESNNVLILSDRGEALHFSCPELDGMGGMELGIGMEQLLQKILQDGKLSHINKGTISSGVLVRDFTISNGLLSMGKAVISEKAAQEFSSFYPK